MMLRMNVPKVLVRGEQAKSIRNAAIRAAACKAKTETATKPRWNYKVTFVEK